MTKFVSIRNLDSIDEDFIIEDPDWIDFDCTIDQTPKVKLIVSLGYGARGKQANGHVGKCHVDFLPW